LLARDGKLPCYHVLQEKLDTLAKNIEDRYPNASFITHAMDAGDAVGAWSKTRHMFLPKQFNMQVGQPLIVQPIIPKEGGGYQTKSDPEVVVDEIFMPYFADRMNVHT